MTRPRLLKSEYALTWKKQVSPTHMQTDLTLTCKQAELSDATQVTPFIAVLASLSQQISRVAHDSLVIRYESIQFQSLFTASRHRYPAPPPKSTATQTPKHRSAPYLPIPPDSGLPIGDRLPDSGRTRLACEKQVHPTWTRLSRFTLWPSQRYLPGIDSLWTPV
jgi:hypothetical protein